MSASDGQIQSRRERAANALLEDERLRGELTDDAYEPIQRWALAWVDAYARATAGVADDEAASRAVDGGIEWSKAQVRALVDLVAAWEGQSVAQRRAALGAIAPTFPAPGLAAKSAEFAKARSAAEASRRLAPALPRAPG